MSLISRAMSSVVGLGGAARPDESPRPRPLARSMSAGWVDGIKSFTPDAAAVDVTLLGRFYERFADHAVEVARRVIFQVTGHNPDEEQLPAAR